MKKQTTFMMRGVLTMALGFMTLFTSEAEVTQSPLFISGENGYNTYRIPALAVAKSGVILAFCEGRKSGVGDAGNIDMLLKRSTDGGRTWSAQQVVWDDAGNTCGNPAPVVDAKTGTIFLLMTWNRGDDAERDIIAGKSKDTRRVFVTQSQDEGRTWTTPREITASTKLPEWTWYATGPGAGIQVKRGAYKGRLIIPCDNMEAGTGYKYAHVIYSDDHGATWQLGARTPGRYVNECEVVELHNGDLMLNMRNYDHSQRTRQVAISHDGGETWEDQAHDSTLIEPTCQASIRRVGGFWGKHKRDLIFSNPAHETKRLSMTLRLSRDNGQHWSSGLVLHDGPSAYSDLAALGQGKVACLYERGVTSPYETITFATIDWEDLQGE